MQMTNFLKTVEMLFFWYIILVLIILSSLIAGCVLPGEVVLIAL